MLSNGNRGAPSQAGQWIPQSAGRPDCNPWLLRKAVAGSAGLLAEHLKPLDVPLADVWRTPASSHRAYAPPEALSSDPESA